MPESSFDFLQAVQGHLHEAARLIALPSDILLLVSQPKNEIITNFPVYMDDGSLRLFTGYRIQHNDLLGPFKGGLHFTPPLAPPKGRSMSAHFHVISAASALSSLRSTSW